MSRDYEEKNVGHDSSRESAGKIIKNEQFHLIYGIILILIFFITYILLQTPQGPIETIRRFAATFGYLAIFLAILSSEYMARMRKISGMPFLKAHHNLARIGILLILIHPLTFILEGQSIKIFSLLYPTNVFISLGGRPALYLLILAAGIALYRKKYRNWRKVHYLNYLAFLLVSVHALMIGTDFRLNIMRILALTMAIIVVGIFINKRSARR